MNITRRILPSVVIGGLLAGAALSGSAFADAPAGGSGATKKGRKTR